MVCGILMLYFLTASASKGISCLLTDRVNYTKHTVDLSRRHLQEIPRNISIDTEILNLSYNEIQNITNGIFANLSRIITLDLSNNAINLILVDSFKGLSRIESLNLSKNQLTNESLHNESFKHISSLKELQIQDNPDYGTSGIFYSVELCRLRLLSTLYLDGIDTDESQLIKKFECFKHLKALRFNSNGMFVTNTTFQGFQNLSIEELRIDGFIGAQSNAFNFFPSLQRLTLTLKYNSCPLEQIFPAFDVFKGRRMAAVTLFGNRKQFILEKSHLRYLWDIRLAELHLFSNTIIDIDADGFSTFAKKSSCLEVLDMSDNPLSTVNVYWWMQIPSFENLRVIRFSHFKNGPSRKLLTQKASRSSVNFTLPPTLQEVSINYGYIKYGLPNVTFINGQSMKFLNLFQIKFPDCLGSFSGLPNLTELDISGFNCTFLNKDILQFLPRLEKFTAQSTNLDQGLNVLGQFGAKLFVNLSNLYYVDLSVNSLESLHSDMFEHQQKSLCYLNLSKNALKNIPISINKLKRLKTLDMTSNKIEYFDENEQELLDKNYNADIKLSGNPFACTCDHTDFLRWIKDRGMKFFVNVECIGKDRKWHNVSEIISSLDNFELNCVSNFWLYFSIIMSSVFGSFILFSSLYYRYRSEIQYFFLKLRIKMKRYNTLEELCEYQFDAFISYSSSDSSWVSKFYRQMTDNGFNLCIDAKDFIAGDGIAENIVRAIDCSRKIIFIVTRNFLKSSWGGYEIEMTRMHAFREGRENMVVLIMKDEIPIDEMPRALKEMWKKIVCLNYYDEDESAFYDSVTLCLR